MKYRITIGGRGAEVITHKITKEQHNIFIEGNVDEDLMSHDEINDVLGLEYLFDDTELRYMGAYPESLYLQVKDENDEVIFTQETIDYDKIISDEVYCDDNHYLFMQDYSKGEFWVYEIEIEEEFDKDKLILELTDVGCIVDLVTGISYDGNKFEDVRDYGDTSSKGFYFNLSDN
jgi:hypothetical protein